MPSHEKSRLALSKPRQQRVANPESPSKIIQQAAFKTNRVPSPPPRTPPQGPSRSRHGRQNSTIRTVAPETFFHDIPPTEHHAIARDSRHLSEDLHDLSLSPRHVTRASIVDNMLLSLDQFSSSSFDWDDRPAVISENHNTMTTNSPREYGVPRPIRSRGHTYSSSHSSEPDFRGDEYFSKTNNHPTHGRRRTNSTSDFQTTLTRIPSVGGEKETSHRTRVYEAQRAVPRTEREVKSHTRGGKKGSKSSATSSVDLGNMIAGSRVHANKRRSASFDLGQSFQKYAAGQTFDSPDVAWASQRVRNLIDAGPEASSGSRREQTANETNGAHPLSPVDATTRPATTARESLRASRPPPTRKVRTETLGTATIRSQEDELQKIRESLRQLPPLPTMNSQPPPNLTQYSHRPSIAATPSAENVPQPKERPGFFRRVFGSAKTSTPTLQAPSTVDFRPPKRESLQRSQDSNNSFRQPEASTIPTDAKIQKAQDLVEQQVAPPTHSAPPTRDGHVIIKKSSFFRRRKKSLSSEDAIPPVPSLKPIATTTVVPSQPSPVSSLREIMGPYLATPVSPSLAKEGRFLPAELDESPEFLKILKSGQPGSFGLTEDKPGGSSSANLEVPSSHATRKSRAAGDSYGDSSFLADSSGNEDISPSSSPRPQTKSDGLRSPGSSAPKARPHRERGFSEGEASDQRVGDKSLGSVERGRQYSEGGAVPQPPVESRAQPSLHLITTKNSQGWLLNDSSEEQLDEVQKPRVSEPMKNSPGESASDMSSYQSATSTPQLKRKSPVIGRLPRSPRLDIPSTSPVDVSDEKKTFDREKALEIFENRDEGHDQVGAWLGEASNERELVRIAFMRLFDWSGQNILVALRGLCARIAPKGESQQVDRVLDAFSRRWCECNPNNGFKSNDVVHTICYSLLLLNTDLHLANIDQKMTRTQFVRNTLHTVRQVASETSSTGLETVRAGTSSKSNPSESEGQLPTIHSSSSPSEAHESKTSLDLAPPKRPTDRLSREDSGEPDAIGGPLVTTPFKGSSKAWEGQMDTVLRGFYQSIARERLPLFGAASEPQEQTSNSNTFLTVGSNLLRRTPSVMSKAQSEHARGRGLDNRTATGRWASKTRSRPRLYPMNTMSSARTSFDDQSSVWTPSVNSSTWSKTSVGKTLTSLSVESFGSAFPGVEYQKSIGFANALSQAIIREDAFADAANDEGIKEAPLLEDESLGLAGAPWAKEGLVKHKHHLDGIDKRSKDRNWNECFAVIEKGWMRLFSFQVSAKTVRQRAKDRHKSSVPVGGGNWMDSAEEIWKFLLRQTIASALPPPGYSKARPHVWALSLPTGAVHLFEVGTPDIVKEFVSAANYWSARMSKEPLVGGISNMEYGWSDHAINRAILPLTSESTPAVHQQTTTTTATISPPPGQPRPSIQSSIRSSLDHPSLPPSLRPAPTARLPGDRLQILDWTPPQQSLMPSALMEVDQLKSLTIYVRNIEDELQKHNELRSAMLLAYSPRHPNAAKAMQNWERKSSYLLREIVKFRTYIEALKAAEMRKAEVYRERDEHEGRAKNEQLEAEEDWGFVGGVPGEVTVSAEAA